MYDPVPLTAVPLCCPRCLGVIGRTTRTRLYVGGACWDVPIRVPCARCGYRIRWRPDGTATVPITDTALDSDPLRRSH